MSIESRWRAFSLGALIALLAPLGIIALAQPAAAAQGEIYTIAGNGNAEYSGDGGPATAAGLPAGGIVVDAEGNVLSAEPLDDRVRVVAVSATNPGYLLAGCAGACTWTVGNIYTVAGNGVVGLSSGDGGPATSAQLILQGSAALDHHGNLLLSMDDNLVRIVAVSATNPGYTLAGCTGPCTWTAGDIYTIAGNRNFGYGGDGGPATSAQVMPEPLAVDPGGNPLIGDLNNERVRVVAVSATNPGYTLAGCTGPCTWTVGDIYTVAGDGVVGISGTGGPATSAELTPASISADPTGNVIVVPYDPFDQPQTGGQVDVIAVSATNPGYTLAGCAGPCTWTVGDLFTIAGNGVSAYAGDGGPATNASFRAAPGVVGDPSGNVLVASNHRVRVVAVSASNPGYTLAGCAGTCTWTVGDVYTVAGSGAIATNGSGAIIDTADGGLATATAIDPGAPAVDANGNVYVADASNRLFEIIVVETAPDTPRSVVAVPGDAQATVNWTAPASDGGLPVTGYTVTPYIGTTALAPRTFGAAATSGVVTGLTNANTYAFVVTATNALGAGPPASTPPIIAGAPVAPTVIRVASNAPTGNLGTLTVTYTAGASNGAPITHFDATCTPAVARSGVTTRIATHFGANASPIVVGGVLTTRNYSCTVRASNARGSGPHSVASGLVAVGAPAPPTGVHPVRTATGELKVNFSPGTNNGAPTLGYTVLCTPPNGTVTKLASGRRSPVTITGLVPGKAYACTVRGTNSRGIGPPSSPSPAVPA